MTDWALLSSVTALAPAATAWYKQPVLLAIILTNASVYSILYHESEEKEYAVMDQIWANLSLLVVIMAAFAMYRKKGLTKKLVLVAVLAISTLTVFGTQPYRDAQMDVSRPEGYEGHHSAWHILSSITATLVLWEDTDWSTISQSIRDY